MKNGNRAKATASENRAAGVPPLARKVFLHIGIIPCSPGLSKGQSVRFYISALV
uniref:Uncharacterized protein n=1 Tax=Siphoviridae sp. ct3o911 TaxID=2827560 RepID=A0A8S5LJ49_9CAUD|nr:MAG TPA: hypothetical protein [Siphoviridae sp. ct3o911]